jgi:aminopeptidase-like protein
MSVEISATQHRMRQFIEKYYMLNRVPVSDDSVFFVRDCAQKLGLDVLSIPSGTDCLTWVVPDKWTVFEAYIETMDGRRLADFHWHPMYLKAYSAAFSGTVSREELLSRISTHPRYSDRLPYVNRWQYHLGEKSEWGFALPQDTVDQMKDAEYRVHIDVEFSSGTLDVIDWIVPGELPDTIFFSAHTCHPGQVNDGIACIALLLELFRHLEQQPNRKYTYRLIVGPEYYAAAGILQHGRDIGHLKYGIYLDMMGNAHPISYSRSYAGDTYLDRIARNIIGHHEAELREAPYRGLYGNDEMFYDGPGFEIPTLGMSRYPFEYYHTDWDDVDHCDFAKLEESITVLQQIIDVFETDCIPSLLYKGPLYLSKYNLYIDPKIDPKGYSSLQEAQILMNGERSCLEIAIHLGISYSFVRSFVRELIRHHLAAIRPVASASARKTDSETEWSFVEVNL